LKLKTMHRCSLTTSSAVLRRIVPDYSCLSFVFIHLTELGSTNESGLVLCTTIDICKYLIYNLTHMVGELSRIFFRDSESLDFYTELLREGKALDEFIEGHLEKAPIQVERAGISKGDSLPFPRTKTHAALLHLKLQGELTSLQQLARQADISY